MWQHIDTVPLETRVIGCWLDFDYAEIGEVTQRHSRCIWRSDNDPSHGSSKLPDFWMPIPNPPKEE